ncbi:MAG: c-type cytochrome [Rhizomicrobium sp.]
MGRQAHRHPAYDHGRRALDRSGYPPVADAGLRPRRHAEAGTDRRSDRIRRAPFRRSADAPAVGRATKLFADNCAMCHGPAGKGNRTMGAPNLTDNEWLYGPTREDIRDQIWNGPWRRDADLGRTACRRKRSRPWRSMSTAWAAASRESIG